MNMRAKFEVVEVTTPYPGTEELHMRAVTEKPFDEGGNSEDNSFAKWSPTGELRMEITNPNLHGTFKAGDKYYLDFTKAE